MSAASDKGEYRSFWRIAKHSSRYQCTDMSGGGGLFVGGRWHTVGTPVIYAAGSIALCCLETLAHYDDSGLPVLRKLVEYKVPADCIRQGINVVLPAGWDTMPDSANAAAAGTAWLNSRQSLLMYVPSVIIQQESNVLINPLHPDIGRIQAIDHGPFKYDPRLIGKLP
ncbi:RES family NAD+ phosphorylase [Diaphorobacter sp. HDW4A]|uniref:RES family NAD+ phosphorylase n=1 Tax=Diaphorobacter sp. HDW4A TaxID=2714924 RepID=UPI00140CFC90|nr:RES family NAD+ phosphorylase [Diaphorobacter sp. HDW4A]QIL80157.1 RES family NAD+ phosphorylase [Diaphorobacter sp. HDW4A]